MIKIMDWGQRMRYEEPHPIYLNKDNIGGMIERHEEDGDFTEIYTKEECPAAFLVKETPEEILTMPDIETTEKVIDWEQRRFDVISQLFVKFYPVSKDTLPYFLGDIIPRVDALINELKKGQDNEN